MTDLGISTDLSTATLESTPGFDLDGVDCVARVLDCYDGDTLTVALPVPWAGGAVRRAKLRLLGVNTPELRGPDAVAGLEARNFVLCRLAPEVFRDDEVLTRAEIARRFEATPVTVRVRCGGNDKYGRVLARVGEDGACLNDALIARGFVAPWD